MNNYYTYILTNSINSVLYVGITNNLQRRMYEHKKKLADGFTKKYNVSKLIYFEQFSNINDAIAAEKRLKNWHREWKFNLIKESNPDLHDLLLGDAETSSA